jgi:hypothetical protein
MRKLLKDRHRLRCAYRVEIRPLLVATIQRLPQRTIESILPIPGTVSPRVALHTPFGPSKTAVPPITSRSVQPSMVVGFVSGTGVGFRDFVGSTAGGCLGMNDSEVRPLRFELSCAVIAEEVCNVARSDLGEASGEAGKEVSFSTGTDVGLTKTEAEFNPQIHPRQMASPNKNAPVIIVTA